MKPSKSAWTETADSSNVTVFSSCSRPTSWPIKIGLIRQHSVFQESKVFVVVVGREGRRCQRPKFRSFGPF
jgi:hypothetical protein